MDVLERVGIGIFLSVLIAVLVFMMYQGVGFVWRTVDDNDILRYFLSSIALIIPLLFIFALGSILVSSLLEARAFSESYKSEALVVDVTMLRFSSAGTTVHFGLVLKVKRKDGSLHEAKVSFHTPVRNMDFFKIGETVVVDVSVDDPSKVRVSHDAYK